MDFYYRYRHRTKYNGPNTKENHPENLYVILLATLNGIGMIFVFVFSFVLLTYNYPLITLIEIQKDIYSHPILSISPFLSSSSYSKFPYQSIVFEQPFSFQRSECIEATRSLAEKTTIDETLILFDTLNETYQSLLEKSVQKGEKCPEEYKQCGLLDSLDNIMCIEEDKECPVNLIIVNEAKNDPIEYKDKYNFTTVKLNTFYIHYTNEAIDNYIVTKFIHRTLEEFEISPFESKPNEALSDYSYKSCSIREMEYSKMNLYQEIGTNYMSRPFIGVDMKCLPTRFYNEDKIIKDFYT